MTTLFRRQKPFPWSWSAWWPGGRLAENATAASPRATASAPWIAAPAARRAAFHDPVATYVSGSIHPPPWPAVSTSQARYPGSCTAASRASVAGTTRGRSTRAPDAPDAAMHPRDHGLEALRPLRMSGRCVLGHGRIGQQDDGLLRPRHRCRWRPTLRAGPAFRATRPPRAIRLRRATWNRAGCRAPRPG